MSITQIIGKVRVVVRGVQHEIRKRNPHLQEIRRLRKALLEISQSRPDDLLTLSPNGDPDLVALSKWALDVCHKADMERYGDGRSDFSQ